MKVAIASLALLLAMPAWAETPAASAPPAAPAAPPMHHVSLSDQDVEIQARLNSQACKSVGQDDGGQICAAAQYLNSKLRQALQAKAPVTAPPPASPPKADAKK